MRLLTHNFLKSNVKGTENGYPLSIEVSTLKYEPSPINKPFILKLLPKINYPAFYSAVQQLQSHCSQYTLPSPPVTLNVDENSNDGPTTYELLDDETIQALHTWMVDVYLVEGALVCPDTGRRFIVKDCIPNMILHEDEI